MAVSLARQANRLQMIGTTDLVEPFHQPCVVPLGRVRCPAMTALRSSFIFNAGSLVPIYAQGTIRLHFAFHTVAGRT
jgi:hypothetical protein